MVNWREIRGNRALSLFCGEDWHVISWHLLVHRAKGDAMSPLRQRMIDDMQLRGLSARTQETYVTAVRQLSKHYRRSPDRISEEELRQYFLYLANEKKVARATATITLCAVRFLYEQTLHRPGRHFVSSVHSEKRNSPWFSAATRCARSSPRCASRSTAPA